MGHATAEAISPDGGHASQLEAIRSDMLRFALLQLRDKPAAEDAVQEALAAAWEGLGRFDGRGSFKSWVYAILRYKIIDRIRQRSREPIAEIDPGAGFDALFDRRGFWLPEERPADWGDPLQELENAQFWRIFDACLNRLPKGTARVFMMREFLGLETGEICQELGMKANHCWVVLHRARMGLRLCLESDWFESGRGGYVEL
ncbi:MAG: sigma-70 family RNA polymerase sigma factor [Gammaproteobacteria bacterium]|nr:sigma-70 family RNA polymerase sigma factor [Gammaproteobacteria bacterium]MBU1654839.1 sigma-70 family RNA polymerase sigma factor [Gammaproteobacteria bacterium]MBU1961106.1 sigma-70 family RNA polymerase sigma factor [Gammaproteobacteria bacterium]